METPFWTVDTLFYCSMKDGNDAKFFYYRFCLIDWMQFNEASGSPPGLICANNRSED